MDDALKGSWVAPLADEPARVLFAKQLLVETRMPLADVAMAAGFGSVRRLDATFRARSEKPPGSLRPGRLADADRSASAGVTIVLPFAPPYDWAGMLGFLSARVIPGLEAIDDRGRYRRAIACDGARGIVCVGPDEDGVGLRVSIRVPRLRSLAAIVGRVRRMFDLNADPLTIGRHLATDPAMAPLVAHRPGLRVPGGWDGFEVAIRAILGQQISVAAAMKLAGKLVAAHGDRLEPGVEGLAYTFPTPQRLAAADLRGLGMPGARAAALSTLAAAAVTDPTLLEASGGLEAAVARLRALDGIGEWTAQYIALRALREPDAFPANDIGLQRALVADGAPRPTARELLARAEAWRPWRAYAAQHLWTADAAARATVLGSTPAQKAAS